MMITDILKEVVAEVKFSYVQNHRQEILGRQMKNIDRQKRMFKSSTTDRNYHHKEKETNTPIHLVIPVKRKQILHCQKQV